MIRKAKIVTHLVLGLLACNVAGATARDSVDDASGIYVRLDEGGNPVEYVVVGNKEKRRFHRYELAHYPLPEVGKVSNLDSTESYEDVGVPKCIGAELEDIDMLNDHYILLSEKTSTVFSELGVLLVYDKLSVSSDKSDQKLGEEGRDNRGLEGLAVYELKKGEEGKSRIGIAWEGGEKEKGGSRRSPRIYHHDIEHAAMKGSRSFTDEDVKCIRLDQDELDELTRYKTSHRVPALVFTSDGQGFIVLISSRKHKWLMRYSLSGEPIGEPCSFESLGMTAEAEQNENWEGLAWYGKDKLVLISDEGKGKHGSPKLYTTSLPEGW